MKIKKIKYGNFRQFMGEQEIILSEDKNKKVTIILSDDNGAGKTTILESLNWCFFNKLNLPNSHEILNKSTFNKMKIGKIETTFVEIEFSYKYNNYIR